MTKENILQKIDTKKLIQFLSLGIVAVMLPAYIHNQMITGSIINAVLILATVLVGIRGAVMLSLFPSVVALSTGLLPAVLAPVVPFIMIGNILLVLVFDLFWKNFENKNIGYITGLVFGSVLKFSFLYLSVNIIVGLITNQKIIAKVAQIMSSMQLTTAIIGGIIALIALKVIRRV